jgi:hypothetical protein
MSFRSIAIGAAIAVILFAILDSIVFASMGTYGRPIYNGLARSAMLATVAAAAGLAARKFGWWSEYVGRAWTLFFAAYTVLTIGEILKRFVAGATLPGEICVVVANVALVGAYIMTARSFHAAGLDFGASRSRTVIATLAAVAIALALCYESISSAWLNLQSGSLTPGTLISPLADVVTFALVAPLLLTAFALRGGQQFWMFALLTTGTIGWMVNQGSGTIVRFAGGSSEAIRAGRMTGFAMACFFIAAAALTQWLAADRAMRGVNANV